MKSATNGWVIAGVASLVLSPMLGGCAKNAAQKSGTSDAVATPATAKPQPGAKTAAATPIPDAVRLAEIREKALTVIEQLSNDADGQVRGYAADAAGMTAKRLAPVLMKALDDPAPGVRALAAMSAGRNKVTSAAPRLQSLTSDDSGFVRAAAIYALKKLGQNPDPTPLAGWLTGPNTPANLRSHAAWVLGEMGERSAVSMLKDAARVRVSKDRASDVALFQLQCAEARIKLGDNEPVEGVRAALFPARPEDFESAVLAVQIIGEVKDRGSIDQLIYLSNYRDPQGNLMPPEFRLACSTALAKMGLDQGSFIADEYAANTSDTIRQQAASVYAYTAKAQHFPALETMLKDPSPMVRVVAAAAVIRAHARINGERLP
ncbi:MAG: HEAT repeat domain-containing protein [Phycisphaerales bacterium]|nr:HEAT repeat domain-containing protein [Phycisphaerales bacterium]